MEHEIKIIPDQKLAVINYKGPIEDLDILVSKLVGWAEAEEVEVEGEPFIVYYSPRHEVNEGDAVYDVGIVLKEDADEKDIIRVVDMVEHKMLSGIHEGPTDIPKGSSAAPIVIVVFIPFHDAEDHPKSMIYYHIRKGIASDFTDRIYIKKAQMKCLLIVKNH